MGVQKYGAIMSSKITFGKWGTSIGARIPQFICDQLEIEPGSQGQIWYKENYICIRVQKTTDQSFDEWLAQELSTSTIDVDSLFT